MKRWTVHNVITRHVRETGKDRKRLLGAQQNEIRKWRMNSLLWLVKGASTSSIDVKIPSCLKWNYKICKDKLTITGDLNDDGSHDNCIRNEKNKPTQNWRGPFSLGRQIVESVWNYRGLERSFCESCHYRAMLMHCQEPTWTNVYRTLDIGNGSGCSCLVFYRVVM